MQRARSAAAGGGGTLHRTPAGGATRREELSAMGVQGQKKRGRVVESAPPGVLGTGWVVI